MNTPGPWTVRQSATAISIHGPSGRIATMAIKPTSPRLPEAIVDAHLIAAAPDLLAACAEFVRKVESGEARSTRSYAQMKAALAKADTETRE